GRQRRTDHAALASRRRSRRAGAGAATAILEEFARHFGRNPPRSRTTSSRRADLLDRLPIQPLDATHRRIRICFHDAVRGLSEGIMKRRGFVAVLLAACLGLVSAVTGVLGGAPAYAATTKPTFLTFYGWWDNTPPGGDISYPQIHDTAGGKGTHAHPVPFATTSKILKPATKI